MSREFPDFIDPWRAAEGGKRFGGTIPLARLKRLEPLLASTEGVVTFTLLFGFDGQRRATVSVHVSAPLSLTCQRSLEPYIEDVRQHSVLQVIGHASEQALLSGDEEYVLVEEGRVAVSDLVEDELLLAVPQVPRNPEMDAVWATTSSRADNGGHEARRSELGDDKAGDGNRQRPFEGLAEMMKNK